jgi:hypothetical protein
METDSILWTKKQFANANLGDKRLNSRLQLLAINMIKKPSESINSQNEKWSEAKAAYRFFDNKKINDQNILEPHINNVKIESNLLDTVLVIQDTCYVGYGHHSSVDDIGPIGKEGSSGIIIHNSIAVNPNGDFPELIGVIDLSFHNRNDEKIEDWKETELWREASSRIKLDTKKTRVIEVMDREGSAFDIMKNCLLQKHEFLVRSKEGKVVRSPFKKKLVETAKNTKIAGDIEIDVQKKKGQIQRKARLEIKYLPIEIPGPNGRKNESLNCYLVQAIEINPPQNQEPLSWYLLTSIKVENLENAIMVIKWYKYRWIIEEHHKAIKTGCNVQAKQLKNSFRIENYLAIAVVIAVRLLQLRDLARIIPNAKAINYFSSLEIKLLLEEDNEKNKKLTIKEFYILVAKKGGFLGRKSDGNPGWQTLWKGLEKLYWEVEGAKKILKLLNRYG